MDTGDKCAGEDYRQAVVTQFHSFLWRTVYYYFFFINFALIRSSIYVLKPFRDLRKYCVLKSASLSPILVHPGYHGYLQHLVLC